MKHAQYAAHNCAALSLHYWFVPLDGQASFGQELVQAPFEHILDIVNQIITLRSTTIVTE